MKYLFLLPILALSACGLHTERVEPRNGPEIVEQPVTVVHVPAPDDPNYHLVMEGSNVICAETTEALNFFTCTDDDYRWLNR